MKTDNVFIGYDKDYKEHLLYRTDNDRFIDIFSQNEYFESDLYTQHLIPFNVLQNTNTNAFKRTIKRIYLNDRSQLLDLSDVYLCPTYKVVSSMVTGNGAARIIDFGLITESTLRLKSFTIGQKMDEGYKDLFYNKVWYTHDELAREYFGKRLDGKECVDFSEFQYTIDTISKYKTLDKKRLLEAFCSIEKN